MSVINYISTFIIKCENLKDRIKLHALTKSFGYFDSSAILNYPDICSCPSKVFMYKNTVVFKGAKFIIAKEGVSGRFIMKQNSCSAQGLTIITGNHVRSLYQYFREGLNDKSRDTNKDVVIEEDVWIGANVTINSGVTIGRGANVGSGSVIRDIVPPYAIVLGNPARVVGFCFTPEEVIEREKALYPEDERLSIDILENNYDKYFLKRLKAIKEFTRL